MLSYRLVGLMLGKDYSLWSLWFLAFGGSDKVEEAKQSQKGINLITRQERMTVNINCDES